MFGLYSTTVYLLFMFNIFYCRRYLNISLSKVVLGTDHLTSKGGGGAMGFFFVQKFLFGQHESQNINFFCRVKCEIFFQDLTLGYMTKTLNHIFFFPPRKSEYFFSNIGNQNISLEKPIVPLEVKWSVPKHFQLNTFYVVGV